MDTPRCNGTGVETRARCRLIEVQIGTYLGEDEVIRTDDVYHRAPDETR